MITPGLIKCPVCDDVKENFTQAQDCVTRHSWERRRSP